MEPSEEELRRRLRAARDESRARSKPSIAPHYTESASWGDVAAELGAEAVVTAYRWVKVALVVGAVVFVVVVKITSG